MKTQEREARAARIEYLEEHLSKVYDLIKFIEGENSDKELGELMFLEGGSYRPLVRFGIPNFTRTRGWEIKIS